MTMTEWYYRFFVDTWRFFRGRLQEMECLGRIDFDKALAECEALGRKYPGKPAAEILVGIWGCLDLIDRGKKENIQGQDKPK